MAVLTFIFLGISVLVFVASSRDSFIIKDSENSIPQRTYPDFILMRQHVKNNIDLSQFEECNNHKCLIEKDDGIM